MTRLWPPIRPFFLLLLLLLSAPPHPASASPPPAPRPQISPSSAGGGVADSGAADIDGDGLPDATEAQLGTNPRHADSDCDSVSDRVEVGDPAQPRDADGDGRPDALESSQADANGNGSPDQQDAEFSGQIVCGRFVPWALPADASDSAVLTVQLLAPADVISVSVQLAQADWAGLRLDAAPVADGAPVQLFDDGSRGDERAGDGVWSRSGWTLQANLSPGERRWAEITRATLHQPGGTTALPGFLRASPSAFHRIVLGAVAPADISPPQALTPNLQRTGHLLNFVAPLPALAVGAGQMDTASAALFQQIFDGFDFLYFFPDEPSALPVSGRSWLVRNAVGQIGRGPVDRGAEFGSPGRLQSVHFLNFHTSGPTLHQTLHRWASYGLAGLGFGQCASPGHWGVAGVGRGQLGGFDPASLTDNGDGTFSAGTFFANANGGDATPLAPLELYLAGLVAGQDVPPIPVPQAVACDSLTYDPAAGRVTFAAQGVATVTIADIQAQLGGPRSPGAGEAQRNFAGLFVAVSQRAWTGAEMAFYNEWARNFGAPSGRGGVLSFRQAVGGRAEMSTATDEVFPVQRLFLPALTK